MVSLEEAKIQIEDLKQKILDVEMSYHDIREIEIAMIRIGSALERMTGSKEVKAAISECNRLIWTIRMTMIAINALSVAEGPVGWLYSGATALALGVMGYDAMMGAVSR